MVNDTTTRMWGIFDETGMFACICCHGFILCVADMVRSGELAKYPLAVVEHLLKTLGEGISAGYDVGCHFDITLSRTPLAQLACQSAFVSLVNLFHSHGHNRKCQVKRLPTYVDGMGLEDLEGCERLFAKTRMSWQGVSGTRAPSISANHWLFTFNIWTKWILKKLSVSFHCIT